MIDYMRNAPIGASFPTHDFFPNQLAFLYKTFGFGMSQVNFHIIYPVVAGVIGFLFFYLFAREYFDEKILESPTKTIETKAWQKLKAEYPDCFILPEADRQAVFEMAKNIYARASYLKFFEGGFAELSFFWVDEKTGIKCKCRPDWIDFDKAIIVDYKTTKNHLKNGFDREILSHNYHFSAGMYIEGVYRVTGIEIDGGRVKALSVGATEYVTKSGGFSKLYEAIENILGSKVCV